MLKKTVFILGAGASWDYGYPTGQELIKNIVSTIKTKDFCISSNGLFTEECLIKYSSPSAFGPVALNKAKLQDVPQYKEFLNDLEQDPLTIDSFLRNYPNHQEVGKQMIAYEILRCEKRNQKGQSPFLRNKNAKNWLKHLVEAITKHCDEPDSILENDLTIITYNYDICLQYQLFDQLYQIPRFEGFAKDYCESLTNRIMHVYGSLHEGASMWEKYIFYAKRINTSNDQTINDTLLLHRANSLGSGIKVIGELKQKEQTQQNHIEKARDVLKTAENIYILGFGFDNDNCNLLELEKLSKIEKVYYTNFTDSNKIDDRVKKFFNNPKKMTGNICEALENYL